MSRRLLWWNAGAVAVWGFCFVYWGTLADCLEGKECSDAHLWLNTVTFAAMFVIPVAVLVTWIVALVRLRGRCITRGKTLCATHDRTLTQSSRPQARRAYMIAAAAKPGLPKNAGSFSVVEGRRSWADGRRVLGPAAAP